MTKAEQLHKDKLAQLGCMACKRLHGEHEPGSVELHHLRMGGWGKGDYKTLIPLCYRHHMGIGGIHYMGTKAFDEHYGTLHGFTQQDLLNDALEATA